MSLSMLASVGVDSVKKERSSNKSCSQTNMLERSIMTLLSNLRVG